MKRALSLLVALTFLTQVGTAQDRIVPELETLKKEYASLVQTADGPHLAVVAELDKKYLARLEREQEAAQQAGNLDGAVAIRAEKKTLAAGGSVPAGDDDKTPGVLRKMRAAYRAEIARLELARARNLKPLRNDYIAELDALVIRLTKEERLQEAVTVRKFRENVPAVPAVSRGTVPPSDGGQGDAR